MAPKISDQPDQHKGDYYHSIGEYPKRKPGTGFFKLIEHTNKHVGDCLTSAELRNASGLGSRRTCQIMKGLRKANCATRVKRGVYSIDHSIPDFVTSCILEKANFNYGQYNSNGFAWPHGTIYLASPKWVAGEDNPWFAWYDLPRPQEVKPKSLFQKVKDAINETNQLGGTFTVKEFQDRVYGRTNAAKMRLKRSMASFKYNGFHSPQHVTQPFYRIYTYLNYISKTGMVENVKRGTWKMNFPIPAEFTCSDASIVKNGNVQHNWETGKTYPIKRHPFNYKAYIANFYNDRPMQPGLSERLAQQALAKLNINEDGIIYPESDINIKTQEFRVVNNGPKHIQVFLSGSDTSFFFPKSDWEKLSKHILHSYHPPMDEARKRFEIKEELRKELTGEVTPSIKLKAEPGDIVHYLNLNKYCNAEIISVDIHYTLTKKSIVYKTCHGKRKAEDIFLSKEDLLKSI
jgi:hypothetical protein